jgi:hypothetical protein
MALDLTRERIAGRPENCQVLSLPCPAFLLVLLVLLGLLPFSTRHLLLLLSSFLFRRATGGLQNPCFSF